MFVKCLAWHRINSKCSVSVHTCIAELSKLWAKSSPEHVFVNEVLLAHRCARSLMSCPMAEVTICGRYLECRKSYLPLCRKGLLISDLEFIQYFSKPFLCTDSFNLYNNLMREVLLWSSFYKWGNETKWLHDLLRVTQLLSVWAETC